MSGVEDFTIPEEDTLLTLDRAHKGYEKVRIEFSEALEEAKRKVIEQYNPLFYESQSVLYEAMAKAARAGFTDEDMAKTMQCGAH